MMPTRTAHKRLLDDVVGILRTSGLDVAPAPDGRPGHIDGIAGADLVVTGVGERDQAIQALHRGRADVRAVVWRHRDSTDPLAIMTLSSLIAMLRDYSPDSDAHRRLDPAPPLPVRTASEFCQVCALAITGRKPGAMYCSKACAQRSWYLHTRAAKAGAG